MGRNTSSKDETIQQLKTQVEQLQHEKNQLKQVVAAIPAHIYWKDENDIIIGSNDEMAQSYGFSSARDLLKRHITDREILEAETAEAIIANDKRVRTTRVPLTIEESGTLPIGRKAVYLSKKVPLYDDKKHVIGIIGTSFEITEQKALQKELEETKKKLEVANKVKTEFIGKLTSRLGSTFPGEVGILRALRRLTGKNKTTKDIPLEAIQIIEHLRQENKWLKKHTSQLDTIFSLLPWHVYWKDKNGVMLGCNEQQAKTLGFASPKELIGHTDFDLLPGRVGYVGVNIDQDVMQQGKILEIEERGVLPNGQGVVYLTKKVPLFSKAGHPDGLLGISVDITERVEFARQLVEAREEAVRANMAKSEFVANISHDIRTPLSGIINTMQVLEGRLKNRKNKLYATNIRQAADTLLVTLNDVIDLVKIESGELRVHKARFNLYAVVREIVGLFHDHCVEKGVELDFEYPKSLLREVISDAARVKRILLNLVGNAVKFTQHGHILVTVSLIKKMKRKAIFQVAVSDTGIGIPADQISLICDRFTKASHSYQEHYEGSGLGLSIVRRFVDDLKGKLEIRSELEQGSTFTCTLPFSLLVQAVTPKIAIEKVAKVPMTTHSKGGSRLRVLLIEDDKVCQLAESMLLTHQGYEVDVAACGEEAFKLAKNPYDLILCDVGLPDIDGFDLLKAIRAKYPANKMTTLVALTAHAFEPSRRKARPYVSAILQKPLDMDALQRIIIKACV